MVCNNPDCPQCYPKDKPDNKKRPDCPEWYPKEKPDNNKRPDCPEWYPKDKPDNNKRPDCPPIQTHVHEFAGSVMIAGSIPHNHRFAGVTSEAIPYHKSHVHAILVNTDFFFNHYHEVGVRTGPAIYIEGEKHIHYVEGETTLNFDHDHDFAFTTFIENPLQD